MTEAKMVFPAYARSGRCKECGAIVYSPQTRLKNDGLPSMSACTCLEGPKLVLVAKARVSSEVGRSDSEDGSKAA